MADSHQRRAVHIWLPCNQPKLQATWQVKLAHLLHEFTSWRTTAIINAAVRSQSESGLPHQSFCSGISVARKLSLQSLHRKYNPTPALASLLQDPCDGGPLNRQTGAGV